MTGKEKSIFTWTPEDFKQFERDNAHLSPEALDAAIEAMEHQEISYQLACDMAEEDEAEREELARTDLEENDECDEAMLALARMDLTELNEVKMKVLAGVDFTDSNA